jgi:hypothetical protein
LGKGIYHGHKITRQAGQGASANLSKFHVCGENQHHRDYRDAGDYGGNADLAFEFALSALIQIKKKAGQNPAFFNDYQ